jgi:hypothetical protein
MKLALLLLLLTLCGVSAAEDKWFVGTFFGREEMTERDLDRVVEVTVAKPKDGGELAITGGFWYTEGKLPAPDFEGTLTSSDKSKAHFTFRDTFANEGTVTLIADGKGARLRIKVTRVKNSRCLLLYEEIWLKRY